MTRLCAQSAPQGAALWPAYRPEDHATGIVHLGLGNFARAHILAYTDTALALDGGDWRIEAEAKYIVSTSNDPVRDREGNRLSLSVGYVF